MKSGFNLTIDKVESTDYFKVTNTIKICKTTATKQLVVPDIL